MTWWYLVEAHSRHCGYHGHRRGNPQWLPFNPPLDFVSRSTQQDFGPTSKPGQAQGPAPTTRAIGYF